jgi:hypothetical protein
MHDTERHRLIDKLINIVMNKVTVLLVILLFLAWNATRVMGKCIIFVTVYNIIK